MAAFLDYAAEFIFILCGFISFNAAYRALENEHAKVGTTLFWSILGVIFMFGKVLPYEVCGILLLVMGGLTMTHQVPVSYTHLDVYKRQKHVCAFFSICEREKASSSFFNTA